MKFCRTCCIPDTRPDTYFDESGQCSACVSYAKRPQIDWEARENELVKLLETTPRNGSGYDCIVPSSGGKDSTFQVLKMIELGARPLVVTATTCHLTPIGRANIDNLARFATTIEITPNKTVRNKLNRLGLEIVGDPSWPEHVTIHTIPFKAACDFGIPLIFFGECANNAYGGPEGTEDTKIMTRRWAVEFGGFLGLRPQDMIGMMGITTSDMVDYMPPSEDAVLKLGITAYFLGQFFEWNSRDNAKVAIAHGMKYQLPCMANWWEWENLDNLDMFWHDHLCWRKYGYGRLSAQLSVDIRNGLITRSDAMMLVRDRDGKIPNTYMDIPVTATAERIGMTMQEFMSCIDRFTNWSLFNKDKDGLLTLKDFV